MCLNNQLSVTNNGQVFISNCCQTFKVTYNNIALFFPSDAFLDFYQNIENCHTSIKNDSDKDKRNIVLSTRMNCIEFRFSVNEIAELHYLLQSALIESKVNA